MPCAAARALAELLHVIAGRQLSDAKDWPAQAPCGRGRGALWATTRRVCGLGVQPQNTAIFRRFSEVPPGAKRVGL